MKNRMIALSVACSLVACGGGDDSSPSPQNPVPPPSTSPSPGTSVCTASPVIAGTTRFLGVLPSGKVGEWHFDTSALTSSYTVDGTSATPVLTRDDATCTYTSPTTGALKTAFVSGSLALSSANVAGVNFPALLMADPESSLTRVAGTYNVLRYEKDTESTGSIESSYATFNVDTSGNWRLCPMAAFSPSCAGPTGSLSANASGGFDVVSSGAVVARMLNKVSGAAKVFVVSVADQGDSAGFVHGMWIGSANDAFVPGANDGVYVTNTTEAGTSMLTLSGLTAQPEARPTAAPLLANNPVQGTFAIVTGDPNNDIGLVSSLGLYADVAQTTGTGAFLRFGVKQVK